MIFLTECYLCGRIASRTLFILMPGDRYRCKSGDRCQRRMRARSGENVQGLAEDALGPLGGTGLALLDGHVGPVAGTQPEA